MLGSVRQRCGRSSGHRLRRSATAVFRRRTVRLLVNAMARISRPARSPASIPLADRATNSSSTSPFPRVPIDQDDRFAHQPLHRRLSTILIRGPVERQRFGMDEHVRPERRRLAATPASVQVSRPADSDVQVRQGGGRSSNDAPAEPGRDWGGKPLCHDLRRETDRFVRGEWEGFGHWLSITSRSSPNSVASNQDSSMSSSGCSAASPSIR